MVEWVFDWGVFVGVDLVEFDGGGGGEGDVFVGGVEDDVVLDGEGVDCEGVGGGDGV